MVDVGSWAQVWKLGFKAPWIGWFGNPLPKNNKKKDEQKKTDSSSSTQEKEQKAPSFQWAENLKEEADKLKQQNLEKLKTDSNYRQQKIDELKWDKASIKQSWELWYQQTLKSIWNDWKGSYEAEKKSVQDDWAKAQEDDWKVSGREKAWMVLKHWTSAGLRIVGNALSSAVKLVGWGVDMFLDDQKNIAKVKKDAEALWLKWNDYLEYITDDKNKEKYEQERINKILTKEVEEEDTVKTVATDRLMSNASIIQQKEEELSTSLAEINKWDEEIANEMKQVASQIAQEQWISEAEALQWVSDMVTWAVSWPVWNTDYLATVNALKSKKTSLEEKANLWQQKVYEYSELIKEHQLKEYELSPFTDNYYETEQDAERYRKMFWDKLYKNEDWSILSQWDQRDRDVYATLKNLERVVFGAAEWVRDENVWRTRSLFYDNTWVWQAVGKEDYSWMFEHDFLKNSDKFLNMTYDAFADIKQKLYEHYDELCDTVVNQSGEEEKVLNQEKLNAFLKQNKSGLAKVSDYIVDAKSGTKYMDLKLWRYLEWDEGWLLTTWKNLWWLKDLLWSLTESESKEWWVGVFHYDKARDWVDRSTGDFWFWDWVRSMVASNPAQTAYIAGSSYFAVFGKAQYAVKWHGFWGSLWRMTTTANQYWKVDKWYKIWKIGSKYTSMAEWLWNITYSTKFLGLNKTVDYFARKWLWMLDEAFVSLPLDLWLNDGTSRDMWMNIVFNGLWWLWKIQSIWDFEKLWRTMENFGNTEDMRKFFIDQTGLTDLAENIVWQPWQKGYWAKMLEEITNAHFHNIMMSDSNKAAWYMSQVLSKNIDEIKWENVEEVEALAKSITENGNIWASLSKNRAKNINQIINEANAKLKKTKNWTDILSIQNKAVADIKREFKGLLNNFDVDKFNRMYKRKFSADKIGQSFSNFIAEWSDATGVPRSDLMLIFMDSMNTKAGTEWAGVIDLFKQKVVQWLSDGSIKSSKWARNAIRETNKALEKSKEPMWAVLDLSKWLENNPEEVAWILSKLDEDWIHDMRETYKTADAGQVAVEEEKIMKGLEKEKAAIEAERDATVEQAIRENRAASKMDMGTTQWNWDAGTLANMREKWQQVLDYAKQIANDPELQKLIREAEDKYIKENPIRGNELEEVIAKDKEQKLAGRREDAEAEWLSLEEYMDKYNIKYDKLLEERAVNDWLKANKGGITRAQYEKQLADIAWDWTRATLPVNQRQEIIENYLKEKYWFDFSDEAFRLEKESEYDKIYREDLPELYNQRWLFTNKEESSIAEKLNMKYERKKWWTIKWDINSLTPEELESARKAISEILWDEWTVVSKETIEAATNKVWWQIDVMETRLWKIREWLGSNAIENPYKIFSTAVNNYVEDMANTNKLAAWSKASQESLEKRFLTVWAWTDATKKLEEYNSILWKLDPTLKADSEKAITEGEKAIEEATMQAEKTAAQKIAEAEQLANRMISDVKKRWKENKIYEWINKALDYLESPVGKKSWLLESTQKIVKNMDDVSQKNFLWSLWAVLKDLQKWKADPDILKNLSKSVVDSWSKKTMNSIIKEVKKWITNWKWEYDVVKLKSFVWDSAYNTNKEKRTNQLKGKEVDSVIKEAVHLKVTSNMTQAMAWLADESKSADEIITNIVKAQNSVKNTNFAKANQIISAQSQDAMYLYQKAVTAATMNRWGKTVAETANEASFAAAKEKVNNASQKRSKKSKKLAEVEEVTKAEEATKAEEPVVEEWLGNMDESLAQWIKNSIDNQSKLLKNEKAITDTITKDVRMTEKERTMLLMWADEEAARIMDAVSKWKSPWMIQAEFLDWEWYEFLRRLLDFKPDEVKEFKLFQKAFIESRKEVQWLWYQIFHWLKNVLFNGSDSLKTKWTRFSLNDLLQAIPARITSGMKWFRTWWVIYDPRVTLTKYVMESNPKEATEFMKWALTDFFKKALAKEARKNLGPNFLKAFNKEASNLDMPNVVAEEYMNLYNKLSSRISKYWVEDRIVQDMLNPMFYNPLEFVRAVWMWDIGDVLKWDRMEDMVLAAIMRKYQWQWNHLPDQLQDLYSSIRNSAKTFESFAWGAVLKNRNALEFGDALWEYMGKVDSLPIGKEQFAEWMNKTLSHIVNLGDDITRRITAIDSALNPLYNKAKNVLDDDKRTEFMQTVDKFLFTEEWGLKRSESMKEGYEEFVKSVKKLWLDNDSEVKESLDIVKQSLDAKETWESRVLTNYLYDKVSQRTDEYLKATWKTPDKFNPADIMNRKALQEDVMSKYNSASSDEIIRQIKRSNQKNIKKYHSTEGEGAVVTNRYAKENKAALEMAWWSAEETKRSENILWGIDMEALLEKWEMPKEEQMKEIFRRVVENWEDYEKLMAEDWFFKDWITESLDNVFDGIEKKAWEEFFTIGKNWEFVLKQEAEEFNWLQRLWAKFTTRWHVMSEDRETQWILANIQKNKETAYVRNNIDFWKIMGKNDIQLVWKNIWLESFLSMSKVGVYEIAGKIDRKVKSSVIQEAVQRVFYWARTTGMDKTMEESWKELIDFLFKYREQIDYMRNTLWMWEHWKSLLFWIDFSKWVPENKLANRLSWLRNFLSNEDIARLATKYGDSAGMNKVWSNFTKDILYNARADLSEEKFRRSLEKANFATQKYSVFRNYNVTNITKAGQQVVSNWLHAQGILRSLAVAGTSEFDELFEIIRRSDMRNLWFDIFESEWKYWERIFDKWNEFLDTTANPLERFSKKNLKEWWLIKNWWLFLKDLVTSNALMRWDRATQGWAVKSSLALAVDDIYKQGWKAWVKEFTEKFQKYNELMKKYWFKERDLMDKERFFTKAAQTLNPEMWKLRTSWKIKTEEDILKYYADVKQEQKFLYDFYRNEYAPFMGKARTSMGTFFVADNIKELGSIEFWDNHKYAMWLMKWATGKVWEYLFDIWTAFKKASNPLTPRGFREVFSSPVVKRLWAEIFEGARTMWEVEKMTNHEFTYKDWAKATVVPVAALSMLFWEWLIEWVQKFVSPEVWDAKWWDFVSNVWDTSLWAAFDFVTDRYLIYAGVLWGDIWKATATARVIWVEEDPEAFVRAFAQTWANQFYKNNPVFKYTEIRSAWYGTDATELINPSTILAEIWLNQKSSKRDQWSEISNNIYRLSKNVYEKNDTLADKIAKHLPVIKQFDSAQADMWVLLPMFEKKVNDTWARWFLKESTSRTELSRLINNMEKNVMLEKDDFKDWVAKNWAVDMEDENAVKMAMIRAWVYRDTLEAFDIVKKWLNKEDTYWEWEAALWLEMMKPEDRAALFDEFEWMYQKYVLDKGKADVATTSMFEKFVLAATKYGWSMSMAGYMWAYDTAYKAAARKAYWITASEVTAWNKWDEWLAAEWDIDLANLPESKYWSYIEYVDAVRDFEMWLIVDNWDVLSKERSIWIEMLNKYIETDKENFWWKKYVNNIGEEDSNMSKLWSTLNYNEISKEQWLPWMIVPLAYQEKKASDNYLKALRDAKTPEDKAAIWEKYLSIQEDLWVMADKYIDNPQASWLVKASLASWILTFADDIRKESPDVLQKVIDIIGEKAINKVLNSLTDSPTVTMADAFEIATWVNAHDWSGWKWKWRWVSIPSAKARENYVNKMLIPNYNRAKAAAAWTGWGDGTSLPKFTTGYGRAKDGSIISVKIPVPQRKQLRDLPTNSIDTQTAKLDVAPLPVKEWRVIGWKYSARAIQNAKVYSRRIGK